MVVSNVNKMSTILTQEEEYVQPSLEMVYSACVEWMDDLIQSHPWTIQDEYDASQYFDQIVKEAIRLFLEYGFRTARARNDAMIILRSLFYEHYKFQKQFHQLALEPDPLTEQRLLSAPQTPQKSAEWLAESYDMLSGHEFGSILVGSTAEREAVIAKKCNPPQALTDSKIVFVTPQDGALNPFQWGWRFEPVAREIYEKHFAKGTVIDTLGRVKHPHLPRLGASPDGLITSGSRCGRLVELKCPSSRQLDGKIPIRYYAQMQLQAEVCDVPAVEYFECAFGISEGPEIEKGKLPYIGKLLVLGDGNGIPTEYKYSPLFPTNKKGAEDAANWSCEGEILEEQYWYVRDYATQTVLRNKRWWTDLGKPAYEAFWYDVEEARADGRYKHKAVPLFIDDATTAESVASDREPLDTEVDADLNTNDEDEAIDEYDAEDEQDEA